MGIVLPQDKKMKPMFAGPIFYIRLKQQVEDKIQSRSDGLLSYLTRQPSQGRARDGGMRVGEMERDVLLAHGISQYTKEAMYDRSDAYAFKVDSSKGDVYIPEKHEDMFLANIPYAFKLLMQELK